MKLLDPTSDEFRQMEERAKGATIGPWLTPRQAGWQRPRPVKLGCVPVGFGPERAAEVRGFEPVDHEGCDVWPWGSKEDMEFAYCARMDLPRALATIKELWVHLPDEAQDDPMAWLERHRHGVGGLS